MNFSNQLKSIYESPSLSIRVKIELISGLKQAILHYKNASKNSQRQLPNSFKELTQSFSSNYKQLTTTIFQAQKGLLESHRQNLDVLDSNFAALDEKARSLQNLSLINSKLSELLNEIKGRKECIMSLTEAIQDHLKFKKAKIQVQFEKRVRDRFKKGNKQNKKNTCNAIC